jgi:hypothetical protein
MSPFADNARAGLCAGQLSPARADTSGMQERDRVDERAGSLRCTLLDRRSSAPLTGARVTCVGRDRRITRYDADRSGSFRTSLTQGAYDLVISAHGYLSLIIRGVGVLAGHHQELTRALIPGDGDDNQSDPATALGGYITDRLGRTVPNLIVQISAEDGKFAYMTRSERDGAFVMHGVVPNMYDLTVSIGERRIARELVPIAGSHEFVRLDLRLVQM